MRHGMMHEMRQEDEDFTAWRERMRRETAGLPYDGPDEAALRTSARALWQNWQAQQAEERAGKQTEAKAQTGVGAGRAAEAATAVRK